MPEDGFCYELINGELIKMAPPGSEHGLVTTTVNVLLAQHVKARRLGVVFGGHTGFQLTWNPDTVIGPDVAFVRKSRIPPEGVPRGYWLGPPDLAIEIISPGDTLKEAKEKAEKWLAAGALMVWTLIPRKRSVMVHRPGLAPVTLTEDEISKGEGVVPGFRCRVADLFA